MHAHAHARPAFGMDAVGAVALCVLVAQMRRVCGLSLPQEPRT
jgi:hypothetical protein